MGAHKTDSNRLVQQGFFEPLGPKIKYSEEKIHLFYRIIKVQISGGLPTDYRRGIPLYVANAPLIERVSDDIYFYFCIPGNGFPFLYHW